MKITKNIFKLAFGVVILGSICAAARGFAKAKDDGWPNWTAERGPKA